MLSLPPAASPRLRFAKALSARVANSLDAIVVIVPAPLASGRKDAEATPDFAGLPLPKRWRELTARAPVKAGQIRVAALDNSRLTLMVLAFAAADATPFQMQLIAARALQKTADRDVHVIAVATLHAGQAADQARDAFLTAALTRNFRMPSFQGKDASRHFKLQNIIVVGQLRDTKFVVAAANANNLTRWLTALPPNKLDAGAYHKLLSALARRRKLRAKWYSEAALRKLGAGAFLAVSAGNERRDAGIMHLQYRPRNVSTKPSVALVGKGIVFDTGGNNLKPHRGMLDMHHDMSGSAVALATLLALQELQAPYAVDCWLAITENRIGPAAYRPQDVVQALNGVTIQVIHTDAEGRMVLADTLALAGRRKPAVILDFATLTGSAIYALTERLGAVLTNRADLHPVLVAAGQASGERVWPFPLDDDFDSDIESDVADVMQCSLDGKGDHILAARFLQRFVPPNCDWIHLDLAPASRKGGLGAIATDVTGFGTRYALELLLHHDLLTTDKRSKR